MAFRFWVAQSAIMACCLALPAFPQHTNPPDKNSTPTSSKGASTSKAQNPPQSRIVEHNGIYEVGGPVLPPKLIHEAKPKWTRSAKKARTEGVCVLSLIVDTDGKPQNIEVEKPIGKGLDKNAIAAVKKYMFAPATLKGEPVPVRIEIQMNFRIW